MIDRTALHEILLRLAGLLADAELARARLALAGGELTGAPRPTLPGARYTFAPSLTEGPVLGTPGPPLLDLTGPDQAPDAADRAAAKAAPGVRGMTALWRAWRLPLVGAPHAGPARVYVVAAEGDLPDITAALMHELAAAGVRDPQVETYGPGAEPAAYTKAARASSALLWTADATPPPRVARVVEAKPGHGRLTGEDQAAALGRLEAGKAVLTTTARVVDRVAPERGEVVPMTFRTDGRWVWSEQITYYLREHGVAPEPDLLAALGTAGPVPELDAVVEHRALAALFRSGL